MNGIAGMAAAGASNDVDRILSRLRHRGRRAVRLWEIDGVTLGVAEGEPRGEDPRVVRDETGPERFVRVCVTGGRLEFHRDPFGAAPLYLGEAKGGALCFASEIKALRAVGVSKPREYWPGWHPPKASLLSDPPEVLARELRRRLENAVGQSLVAYPDAGTWLSGGLDSTTVTALAMKQRGMLHTFAAGLSESPDLRFARQAAEFLKTRHHEVAVSLPLIRSVLPDVIEALESFDGLLVRSSVVHYLAAREASQWTSHVFSGEGSDELFAGYAWIKNMKSSARAAAVALLPGQLHHTALQRVDRCAGAYGLTPLLPYLHPEVAAYALRIPLSWKIKDDCEKWILRQAVRELLPTALVLRPKAKFWQGCGIGGLLSEWAERAVSDKDFSRERVLPNGWSLPGKEELLYYRLFRERVGDFETLEWMGRTLVRPEDKSP